MPNFNPFRRTKREGTTSVFDSKPRVAKTETIVREQAASASEALKTDDKVEEAKGKGPEQEGPAKLVSKPKGDENKLDEIQKSYGVNEHDIKQTDVVNAFWDHSINYKMVQTNYSGVSFYVPNAMPLIVILQSALRLMSASSYLGKFYSNFCPYAVITGYCYMYHFQILKAKEKAGQLDGYEQTVYSRFIKTYPEESIPIPDILQPYFQTIVATKFSDVKYNWICPTIASSTGDLPFDFSTRDATANTGGYNDAAGLGMIVPNIPAMLMMIASFGCETALTLQGKMSDDGIYIPAELNGTDSLFTLGANYLNFTNGGTAITAGNQYSIFQSCGVSTPFRFYVSDVDNARRALRNSSFYGRKGVDFTAHTVAALPDNSGTPATSKNFNRFDLFMNMQKEKSLAFFEYLLEQMMIFCKFYPSSQNFSDIKGVGGLETTILCSLRTSDPHANRHLYPDLRCNIDTVADVSWNPRLFNLMNADFLSTKAGITRPQELQALTFGTVSTPPIHALAIRNYRRGKYYEDVGEQTKKYEIGDFSGTGPGTKPMWQTFTTEVLTRFLVNKPN